LMNDRIDGLFSRPLDLQAFLGHLRSLLHTERRRGGRPVAISQRVSRVVDYMSHHYHHFLALPDIAAAVGLSPGRLAHKFRTEVGMPPMHFLGGVRVEAAKKYLCETDEKLGRIAEQVGFCDASHLSRVFQRCLMCSPGEYRRGTKTSGPEGGGRNVQAFSTDGRDFDRSVS